AKDRTVCSGNFHDPVRVRMHAIGRDRVRLAASSGRSRVRGGIPCHIGKRDTSVRRADKRAPVVPTAVSSIAKRTAKVYDIGFSRRGINYVIVPALSTADRGITTIVQSLIWYA